MSRTRIKICGVTRPQDALAAARCGADAVGIVMQPGARRFVPLERAAHIVKATPPFVTPVLVFVDAPPDEVRRATTALGVRHVQLHGRELPEDVEALRGLAVIKAVRADDLRRWQRAPNLFAVILDTACESAPGGTGTPNDWDAVERALASVERAEFPPIIAAGGLTAETVAEVIRRIRPWAVDVSSGVEDSPGVKSEPKLQAFCQAAGAPVSDRPG